MSTMMRSISDIMLRKQWIHRSFCSRRWEDRGKEQSYGTIIHAKHFNCGKIIWNESCDLIASEENEPDAELFRYQVVLTKSIPTTLSEMVLKEGNRFLHFVKNANSQCFNVADARHELQSHVCFDWKREVYLHGQTCMRCKQNNARFCINLIQTLSCLGGIESLFRIFIMLEAL